MPLGRFRKRDCEDRCRLKAVETAFSTAWRGARFRHSLQEGKFHQVATEPTALLRFMGTAPPASAAQAWYRMFEVSGDAFCPGLSEPVGVKSIMTGMTIRARRDGKSGFPKKEEYNRDDASQQ
jgi:hypothetical protein